MAQQTIDKEKVLEVLDKNIIFYTMKLVKAIGRAAIADSERSTSSDFKIAHRPIIAKYELILGQLTVVKEAIQNGEKRIALYGGCQSRNEDDERIRHLQPLEVEDVLKEAGINFTIAFPVIMLTPTSCWEIDSIEELCISNHLVIDLFE